MILKLDTSKFSTPLQRLINRKQIGLDERLLAEAVRLHEDAQGFAIQDPQADAKAREADGNLEQRVIVRAQSLEMTPSLLTAFHQLRSVFGFVIAIGLLIAVIAGATAAQVALGSQLGSPVINFFWVLGSLLGVPTVALLLWLILLFTKPNVAASGSLGSALFFLGRRVNQWLHKGPSHMAAVQALGSVYLRTSIGRWTLSAISHGFWLAFLTGCLVLVILILSTKQYNFAWETTILSDRSYVTLTRAIATFPEALGFTTPDAAQISASHWTGGGDPPGEFREAWSGLLVGSIVVYGLLPRALLLLFCLLARQRANSRFRLDTSLPSYTRLQSRLQPSSQTIGVVDPDQHVPSPAIPETAAAFDRPQDTPSTGPAAILGLEIDKPSSSWPPPINGVDWLDLGLVDTRDDRRRALEQVRSAPTTPRLVAIVCSAATTPDRGTQGFIADVQKSSSLPVVIVLTDGQRLRERGHFDEVEQRFADWRALAASAHVSEDRVIDVDLDHLTDASRAKLATAIGVKDAAVASARRIEQAFALILKHVQRWSGEPDAAAQAELHRAIAELYRNERQTWRSLLHLPMETGNDVVGQLKSGANHMLHLLPERLRRSPKWYAAGALAGAMGCVAATTLISPAAIASLPMWAGLGAALSAVIPSDRAGQSPQPQAINLTDAVNSAALFALLLELQGRDEIQITRIIDQVAGNHEPPVLSDGTAVRQWLETLRHRFDLALAAGHSS